MKVLIILGFPNPFPGAAWTRIGFFAEDWARRHNEVHVLGVFSYRTMNRRGSIQIGKVKVFNLAYNIGIRHPVFFLMNCVSSFLSTLLFLAARRPDISVISLPFGFAGPGAIVACELARVRYVIDYRDEWEDVAINRSGNRINRLFYSALKALMNVIYRKRPFIACVTPKFEKSLIQRGVHNVVSISNGADLEVFTPIHSRRRSSWFTVFFSGHIGTYYRIDILLKAISHLVSNGLKRIRVVLAGPGEIKAVLDLAHKLGISKHVSYVGAINDRRELANLISNADVGVIPYDDNALWKNTLPAKFFEYCACGIPVIATAYNDAILSHLIHENNLGLTVPPLDSQLLAQAIKRFYHNETCRKETGVRARLFVEMNFNRQEASKRLLQMLKSTIR